MGNNQVSSIDYLRRVNIVGVPITATNMHDCLGFITEHLDEIRGEYICVSNVHTTVMAHDDPAYMAVQSESIMSVPDGKPLSIIGKKAVPDMDRVTGPDLMRELFNMPETKDKSHYFYGNSADNLAVLIGTLETEYPDLKIAGYEPSVFRPLTAQEQDELAQRINASGADYAWIAIGAPRQEVLCRDLKGKVNALMVGVGGAFNILAHITPEAPRWMQNLSLEWLYRLIQEPGRLFKRYLVTNSKFIAYNAFKVKPRSKESKGMKA